MTWHGERAALARAVLRDDKKPLLAAALHSFRRADDSLNEVRIGGEALGKARLSTVMPAGSYEMLLEELPNAPPAEMQNAIGWRIRDRIETPLEEAVIELLEMPPQARAATAPMAYAIVAKRADVVQQVEQAKAAGLKLDTIDLPELCQRNVARLLPQDQEGVAFLHFGADSATLTITRQGTLYLVRHIDIKLDQLEFDTPSDITDNIISAMCLDLQRSLDYYETQYDLPSISTLWLGPGANMQPLADAIATQLGLGVNVLDLGQLFELDEPLDAETQNACLLAVGAALRADDGAGGA